MKFPFCLSLPRAAPGHVGPKYEKDFWRADVTKMIKLYGAPIEEMDVPKIVEYLAATYRAADHCSVGATKCAASSCAHPIPFT